jgi:hypothetical protein
MLAIRAKVPLIVLDFICGQCEMSWDLIEYVHPHRLASTCTF